MAHCCHVLRLNRNINATVEQTELHVIPRMEERIASS
jgi:hypothetical protein